MSTEIPVRAPRRAKPTACHRCHSRKVKCSGGYPCNGCRQADKVVECVYPRKNRVVKVRQQYIDNLVSENRRLRENHSPDGPQCDTVRPDVLDVASRVQSEEITTAITQAPTLADAPWFVSTDVLHTPILVAEASDSAFATRFRQAMSNAQHSHIPRVNYPSDEQLLAMSEANCPWPSPARARLLVSISVRTIGRCYHIVRSSTVVGDLEASSQNPASTGLICKSKLWALFAIGEMYATRTSVLEKGFPGMDYFAQATRILRVVSERPILDIVEIYLLLSFYSLCLNRRHSAYSLAGSAVRLSIIMGLHLNVPESQLSDAGEREHRNRVWWTAYTFDRMWAAKLGYPFAIRDEEIEVDLPSSLPFDSGTTPFADRDIFVARIGLARLSGRIIYSIYGKKAQQTSLSQRVQEAFKDLRLWLEELPTSLQIDPRAESEIDPRARSLHLLFNQLAILATRPILLHVLRTRLDDCENKPGLEAKVPLSASALSETCVRCARHSCRLLSDSWVNGSFMIFDYFYTQYLFSSATVLAISSLVDGKECHGDEEQFELAVNFLIQLRDNGNYAAAEFCQHIEAMRVLMATTKSRMGSCGGATTALHSINNSNIDINNVEWISIRDSMTAETALSEPFLQELLEQPLPDLQFIDESLFLDEVQGLYWPNAYSQSHAAA